jgi:Raf kinase inhibitor-like YbhB/YbcL family protein
MRFMRVVMVVAIMIAVAVAMAVAQAPAAGQGGGQRGAGAGAPPGGGQGGPGAPSAGGGGRQGGRGQRGPALSVTSTSWQDGGEVPPKHAGAGANVMNVSPAFEFKWFQGASSTDAPATLQTYAVIFHDMSNAGRGATTTDTLHWTAWNIPGTAKSLAEGLPAGDLPDGTRQGPGIRGGSYFGPGAGAGPFHHYVFEFYALDTKLDLPATATREQLLAAMDSHVIGKAAFFGRYHQ